LLEELGLLSTRRHTHAHASFSQKNVHYHAIGLVVEVEERASVEVELRRPNLGERGMGAKHLEERRNLLERRSSHPQAVAATAREHCAAGNRREATFTPCHHGQKRLLGGERRVDREIVSIPRNLELGNPSTSVSKPAEDRPEERVTPGRLGERARIHEQWWDAGLTARRVVAIDEVSERVEGDVLGERHAEYELPRVDGELAPKLVIRKAEDRPVEGVDRESPGTPTWTSGERLAEHSDVRVVTAEEPLVDRLLQSPDGRGCRAGCGEYQPLTHGCDLPEDVRGA